MAHLPHSLYSAARPEFLNAGKSGQPKWSRFPGILRCASTESLTSLTQNATETELKYMVSQHGWGVRRLRRDDEEEIRRVSLVQAEAFHIPLALFNDFSSCFPGLSTLFLRYLLDDLMQNSQYVGKFQYIFP
ncbi:hypothetical protein Bca52824_083211 [Brassica carinata]|uniref:Uncharacterized protein n=1 Tax=Brassica carinata TaxID=52824 RepID=A0A8X7PKX5_BRACI|nr:hypothetical protein Bca52824_083211 [Brassica carinata]